MDRVNYTRTRPKAPVVQFTHKIISEKFVWVSVCVEIAAGGFFCHQLHRKCWQHFVRLGVVVTEHRYNFTAKPFLIGLATKVVFLLCFDVVWPAKISDSSHLKIQQSRLLAHCHFRLADLLLSTVFWFLLLHVICNQGVRFEKATEKKNNNNSSMWWRCNVIEFNLIMKNMFFVHRDQRKFFVPTTNSFVSAIDLRINFTYRDVLFPHIYIKYIFLSHQFCFRFCRVSGQTGRSSVFSERIELKFIDFDAHEPCRYIY